MTTRPGHTRRMAQGLTGTAVALLSGIGQAAGLPEVPVPPGAETESVAREMTYNGMPMSIRAFRAPMTVERVLGHYERRWQRELPRADVRRQRRDGWRVIMARTETHFISVRARRRNGRAMGVIAVSREPGRVDGSRATELPLPDTMKVVSRQQYRDGGRRAVHLLVAARQSVGDAADRLDRRLTDAGWSGVAKRRSEANAAALYREYRRGGGHLQLTLAPADGAGARTVIVVNRIRP